MLFFLVTIALAITVGIGIAFGSFRVWLLEEFPNNRFNGTPVDDPGETFACAIPASRTSRRRLRSIPIGETAGE